MTEPNLTRRIRVVVAAFGDGDRGRTWRERLGSDYARVADVLVDSLAALGVDFDELDGDRVREVLGVHVPARLGGRESFAADLPDVFEELLDFAADHVGVARKWEWLTAVGEARADYDAALADADRLRVAPSKQTPHKRPGAKLGRNDPCPCGSGRKYKQCCMNR